MASMVLGEFSQMPRMSYLEVCLLLGLQVESWGSLSVFLSALRVQRLDVGSWLARVLAGTWFLLTPMVSRYQSVPRLLLYLGVIPLPRAAQHSAKEDGRPGHFLSLPSAPSGVCGVPLLRALVYFLRTVCLIFLACSSTAWNL